MNQILDELLDFKESPLYEYRIENNYHPVVGEGDYDADIIFIGEAPGETEAKTAKPFCGRSGKVLDVLLRSINLDRNSVYVTNVVKDRPPKNRDPKPAEIELYAPFLRRQIEIINPKVIATLGRFAMEFMFKHFSEGDPKSRMPKISQAHGKQYTVNLADGTNLTLLPLYHPAVALYNPNNKSDLLKDFQIIKELIG